MLSSSRFFFVALPVLLGPWLFGAWEQWWFWPLAVSVFGAGLCLGLASLRSPPGAADPGSAATLRVRRVCALSFAPFLLYASVRGLQADVYMSAERSVLLFLTPFILALTLAFGATARQRETLFLLMLANLYLLGAYGILNHAITGSRFVLWEPGYPQYIAGARATGSYFCPDHFAGIMEIAMAMAVGLLCTRRLPWTLRALAGVVAATALAAVIQSKSRGGGLSVLVILLGALCFGLSQWPRAIRWYLRIAGTALLALALLVFALVASGYVQRFTHYFGWEQARGKPLREQCNIVMKRLEHSDRGLMIAGALRAWRATDPVWGAGPGMHQHLWPRFATSDDGDREARRWPSILNNTFHSYEAHSDWTQLLEEYGIVGLVLLLAACAAWFLTLRAGLRAESETLHRRHWRPTGEERHPAMLAALLAGLAMAFHSLGDFNLQMPATTWMLGALLGIGLAGAATAVGRSSPWKPGS